MIVLSAVPLPSRDAQQNQVAPRNLGEFDLVGEIVDRQVLLGNMNPGNGKVHRDCAVRLLERRQLPPFSRRMTSTALLRWLLHDRPESKKALAQGAFLDRVLNQCGFMERSCRSVIHCCYRPENRPPLLLTNSRVHHEQRR